MYKILCTVQECIVIGDVPLEGGGGTNGGKCAVAANVQISCTFEFEQGRRKKVLADYINSAILSDVGQ